MATIRSDYADQLVVRAEKVGMSEADLVDAVNARTQYGDRHVADFNHRAASIAENILVEREQRPMRDGVPMATPRQIAYIEKLRRQRPNGAGGFFYYEGDPALLTRQEASQLIDSLRGTY